jgi:tetratricopeptide (TPR) repeat protein
MRRILCSIAAFVCLLGAGPPAGGAQIGKVVAIQAGTPQDAALSAINAAPTSAQKIALLDKFLADFGQGDMALVAYEQYVAVYTADKNYDKAFEFADKGLAADPDDFGISYSVFRAAQEKGDVAREFRYGEILGGIVTRYKAQTAPANADAAEWQARKKDALTSVADTVNYVSSTLFEAARVEKDPKTQAALLERYSVAFPDSPYTEPAQALAASNYRQLGDYAKMTAFAQSVLAKNPDNTAILLLLADDGSERAVNLGQADQYAHKVLDLLAKAQKPAGVTDDECKQRISIQQGIAWSSIGQVAIQKKNDAAALDAFQKAAALLKSEPFTYARNQYRMGFALVNLKRNAEARVALTQAASLDTPYKPLAQEKLKSLSTARPTKKAP